MSKPHNKELCTSIIISYVKSGLTIECACRAAGVAASTFRNWRRADKSLSNALKKAEADFERVHIQNVSIFGERDWKASAWLLERKFPERYAKRVINIEPKPSEVTGILVKVPEPRVIEASAKVDNDGV